MPKPDSTQQLIADAEALTKGKKKPGKSQSTRQIVQGAEKALGRRPERSPLLPLILALGAGIAVLAWYLLRPA